MDFNDLIRSSKVVLVEFFATWCPHCQRMMPIVAQIKELLDYQAEVHQFDIDRRFSDKFRALYDRPHPPF